MNRTSLAFFRMAARSSDEQVSSELALAADDALAADARQRAEIRALKELLSKSLSFIWDMNRPSVTRRFEHEDAVRTALAPKRGGK